MHFQGNIFVILLKLHQERGEEANCESVPGMSNNSLLNSWLTFSIDDQWINKQQFFLSTYISQWEICKEQISELLSNAEAPVWPGFTSQKSENTSALILWL